MSENQTLGCPSYCGPPNQVYQTIDTHAEVPVQKRGLRLHSYGVGFFSEKGCSLGTYNLACSSILFWNWNSSQQVNSLADS